MYESATPDPVWNRLALFTLVVPLTLAGIACWGPQPTKAIGATQRQTPFYRVLVYERIQKGSSGIDVDVLLFEDEGGNCWITSGQDGGVVAAPASSCEAAKADPAGALEKPSADGAVDVSLCGGVPCDALAVKGDAKVCVCTEPLAQDAAGRTRVVP